ncbi:Yip1 family protein [Melghirimyces algeriensis]|uniref:Yip1 domain-containing protein n=1 Tax=Melghirimyces algeriensis TaxID=910412 RepID=A0A521EAX9_9BACL|nr:Yip1 family protein [Melghirimyces algeriensis]SMO80320.1 Yip1 domain-containing protein [Melghirimyces algeriensis]
MQTQTVSPEPTGPKKPSILGMITDPGSQYSRIAQHPVIWKPLLILTLFAMLFTVGTGLVVGDAMDSGEGIPEGVDEAQFQGIVKGFQIGILIISGLLVVPLTTLFMSLIYWLFTMLFRGEATYRQILSLNIHTYVIPIIGMGVQTLVYLTVGVGDPTGATLPTSLAGLLQMENGALKSALNSIELFQIWQMVLIAGGLAVVANLSKKQSWVIVITLFLIGMGLSALGGWVSTSISNIPMQ